jgi:hypothetical protein
MGRQVSRIRKKRSKAAGRHLPLFEELSLNSKIFGDKRERTFEFKVILKGMFKKTNS